MRLMKDCRYGLWTLLLWMLVGCGQKEQEVRFNAGIAAGSMLRELANDADDSLLNAVISEVDRTIDSSENYIEAFAKTFSKYGSGKMAAHFTEALHTDAATDERVLQILKEKEERALNEACKIIETRAKNMNLKASVKADGQSRTIAVSTTTKDESEAIRLLLAEGRLEFFEAYSNEDMEKRLFTANDVVIALYNKDVPLKPLEDSGSIDSYVGDIKDHIAANSLAKVLLIYSKEEYGRNCVIGYVTPKDVTKLREYLDRREVRDCFPKGTMFKLGRGNENSQQQILYPVYAIKMPGSGKAELDGDAIEHVTIEKMAVDKGPAIYIEMKADKVATWTEMTRRNVGNFIAVVYDDQVISCPRVDNVISSGSTEIAGGFDDAEARNMVNSISSGRLPYPLRVVRR